LPAFLINHNVPFTEINSDDDIGVKIFEPIMKNQRDIEYQLNKKIRS
jgi:hypothetical protein